MVGVLLGLGGLVDACLNNIHRQANRDQWKFGIKNVDAAKWVHFKKFSLTALVLSSNSFLITKENNNLDEMWEVLKDAVCGLANEMFSKHWFYNVETSKFTVMLQNGLKSDALHGHLSKIKKRYRKFKYYKAELANSGCIRDVINKCMKNFNSNKSDMIRSILEWSFCKIVLDHLVIGNELILEPEEVRSRVDKIMVNWTRKRKCCPVLSGIWAHQYAPLVHVNDDVFLGVMHKISLDKLSSVVSRLSNDKATGLSGIFNELWKHSGDGVMDGIMTDFGLLDGYVVHNGLDQSEVFSPLLWRIFYDSLLCEIKRQEHLCGYRIISNFVAKSGRVEFSGDDYLCIREHLHEIWARELNVYTDSSLSDLDIGKVACRAAAFFSEIGMSVSVRVQNLLSFTLAELQAIALALECIPSLCSVVLYSNSQVALDVCVLEKTGPRANVLDSLDIRRIDWECTISVWHLDSHMLTGFTSRNLAVLHTYLMKAVHRRLPVAIRKRLYDKCYPSVLCLMCGEVEFSDHAFTCSANLVVRSEVISGHINL
ncbi:hypothetical protein G9A89_002067 [Geosiphon pyriformis]|nr:hypothetical protein G9A89_002067 [Geosiphon pyriformis]